MSKDDCARGIAARRGLCFAPLALASMLFTQPAWPETRTWTGGAGVGLPFWDYPGNWNTGEPQEGDVAALGAFDTVFRYIPTGPTKRLHSFSGTGALTVMGVLSYQAASSTGSLVMSGGWLGGKGTLTTGSLVWSSGGIGIAGVDSLDGTVDVNGATTISGEGARSVNGGHALNLKGNSTWSSYGSIQVFGAGESEGVPYRDSSINVFAGKSFTLQGNNAGGGLDFSISGAGTFNNAGTVTKTGSNALTISNRFNNTGTLKVNAGTVHLGGSQTLTGSFNVSSGATLHFSGISTFDPAAAIAGGGNLVFQGVNIVASGTRTFGGTGNKTLAGGNLGGAGTTVFNRLAWTGGMMGYNGAPGGTTTVTGTTTLGNGSTLSLDFGRTLNLNGGGTWAGSGILQIGGVGSYGGADYAASVIKLAAGKTLTLLGNDDTSSLSLAYGTSGVGTFNNAGTLVKTGGNFLVLGSNFSNTGTLRVDGGTAYVISSFNNTGTLHANGGRIEVSASTLPQWSPGTKTLTAGTYRVTGSQPIVLDLGYAPGTGTPAVIKTNKAKIYLEGPGAAIISSMPDPDVNALRALTGNRGVLSLTDGATLAITGSLRNRSAGSLVVGQGSALTLGGGTAVYNQIDTAATFLHGTLSAKTVTIDAGSLSTGDGAGLVGNGALNASVGGLSFGAAARYDVDLSAGDWDRLAVATGNVVVDGTLNATFGAGVGVGTYRFLTTDAGLVSGTFDSVVSNLSPAQYTVQVVYGAKSVDLQVSAVPGLAKALPLPSVTAVPEPQSNALLASGIAWLGWLSRRRARRSKSGR